jgi:hypothetical protein
MFEEGQDDEMWGKLQQKLVKLKKEIYPYLNKNIFKNGFKSVLIFSFEHEIFTFLKPFLY